MTAGIVDLAGERGRGEIPVALQQTLTAEQIETAESVLLAEARARRLSLTFERMPNGDIVIEWEPAPDGGA